MTFRISGTTTGFGNVLDFIKSEARSKQGKDVEGKNGLKVGTVLYVFKSGEKIPPLSNWSAGESGDDISRVICIVPGVTDAIPIFIDEDFQKSLQNQMTSAEVFQSSLGRFPVFVARNKNLPIPLPGDSIFVSFIEIKGVTYGVYEDYYLKAVFAAVDPVTGLPLPPGTPGAVPGPLGAGGGNAVTRTLKRSPELEAMAKSGGAAGYFAKFKLAYNKDAFRNNMAKTMGELKAFGDSERKKLAFKIAAWDGVMGGDYHAIIPGPPEKREGFDCIGQNSKILAIAHYLYKGVPYMHPLGRKEKPLQLIQNGKFVYSGFIHYLSFEGSNDLIYVKSTAALTSLPLGAAGISKRFGMRGTYVATFGHIYTLVDTIGEFTIWCEGRTAKTTRLTVMGKNGQPADLDLSTTEWSGMDEGAVGRVTNAYSQMFWKNKEGVPESNIPYAYIGVLKESW